MHAAKDPHRPVGRRDRKRTAWARPPEKRSSSTVSTARYMIFSFSYSGPSRASWPLDAVLMLLPHARMRSLNCHATSASASNAKRHQPWLEHQHVVQRQPNREALPGRRDAPFRRCCGAGQRCQLQKKAAHPQCGHGQRRIHKWSDERPRTPDEVGTRGFTGERHPRARGCCCTRPS